MSTSSAGASRQPAASTYPGERLGRPAQGPGALAGWGSRILALGIDWAASMAVAAAFVGTRVWSSQGWEAWLPLLVFWLEAGALTALLGGSFGQVVTRVAVVHVDGRPVSLLVALLRTLLICLVIPPVIYNRDRRGLHDLATTTMTVRR